MRFLIRRLGRTLRNALPVLLILLPAAAACQNRVVINADLAKDTISRNIYGHFSEHLGRCIYGGYYVGEGNTKIPNTRGIRAQETQDPEPSLARRLLCRHLPLERRHRSPDETTGDGQ